MDAHNSKDCTDHRYARPIQPFFLHSSVFQVVRRCSCLGCRRGGARDTKKSLLQLRKEHWGEGGEGRSFLVQNLKFE